MKVAICDDCNSDLEKAYKMLKNIGNIISIDMEIEKFSKADKLLEEDFDTDEVIVVDAKGGELCLTVSGKETDKEREAALVSD